MSPLIEQITANDPTFKELKLGESAEKLFGDVSEIVEALGQNTHIDYVRIDRDFLPSLLGEPEKKAAVVKAIGKLPALRELRIMTGPVHANVLGEALQDASNLENLELGAVNLKGSVEDFKILEEALHGHQTLAKFALANFTVDRDDVSLNELVKALGSMPALKVVNLEVSKEASAHMDGDAFATLFDSSILEELRIVGFRLYPQHYDLIKESLKEPQCSLKKITLNRVGMANPCSMRMSEGLAVNCHLEVLDLSRNNIGDEGAIALANSLKQNKNLKHLRLWDNKDIGNEGYQALCEMLSDNSTLEKIDTPLGVSNEYCVKIGEVLKDKARAAIAA